MIRHKCWGLFLLTLILIGWVMLGGVQIVMQPASPLPDRVKLLPYFHYMALSAVPAFAISSMAMLLHQIRHPEAPRHQSAKHLNILITVWIGAGLLAAGPRYYWSQKIDTAQYHQCPDDHFAQADNIWTFYAKQPSLCSNLNDS